MPKPIKTQRKKNRKLKLTRKQFKLRRRLRPRRKQKVRPILWLKL